MIYISQYLSHHNDFYFITFTIKIVIITLSNTKTFTFQQISNNLKNVKIINLNILFSFISLIYLFNLFNLFKRLDITIIHTNAHIIKYS